jgi:hypothetical protein
VFELVAHVVCRQLEQIIAEEDDEERGFITAKDFMNDFATEEFLTKNIRVRPVSGVTRGDQDETKTNDAQARFMSDGLDDDEKFNKNMVLDMEEQRKGIKKQREELERLRLLEEEKKAKKRGM